MKHVNDQKRNAINSKCLDRKSAHQCDHKASAENFGDIKKCQ